jgi:hypothetical protein
VSERNFGRDQRGLVTLGWPAFALTLLLAPMCRDFGGSVTRPSGSGATESGEPALPESGVVAMAE